MNLRLFLASACAAAVALGQQESATGTPQFRASSQLVLVPVQVADKTGRSMEGLTEADFELFDAGVMRKFRIEPENAPLSVVVAIQSGAIAGPVLAKLQKVGSLFQPLVAGERGQVAVLTYSDHLTLRQDFTSDAAKMVQVFRKLEPDGAGGALHDAVIRGVELLKQHPAERRRVLVVIGEAKDRASQASLAAAVSRAQEANVTVYAVSFSPALTAYTSKGDERFASGRRVFDGQPMNILDIFREIGHASAENGHEALAKFTGGMRVSFTRLKGLEDVIQKVGVDLHSQYLLSFQPLLDSNENGYRELRIRVRGAGPGVTIRHRPGYWKAPE